MKRVAAVAFAVGLVLGPAQASPATRPLGPIRWSVAQATSAMLKTQHSFRGRGTHVVLVSTYGFATNPAGSWDLRGNKTEYRGVQIFATTGVRCRGVGKAYGRLYTGFACALQLASNPAPDIRTATYFMRPWGPKLVCLSDRTVAACPPPLPQNALRGDPRNCSYIPGQRHGDAALCILRTAEYLAYRPLIPANTPEVSFGCLAVTVFVYRCTAGGSAGVPLHAVSVTFGRRADSWSMKVVAAR